MCTVSLLCAAAALAMPQVREIPFRIGEDAIIVDAVVNGRRASFMFDTGFSGAVVMNDSIDIGKATGTITLRDFVGELQAKTVKIKTLKLGDVTINATGMEAVQQPMASLSDNYN